jgi:hypothetical protein
MVSVFVMASPPAQLYLIWGAHATRWDGSHTAVLAHAVDRHDSAVMRPRRRSRLQLKSFHLDRVNPAVQGEDFQGNPPAERLLDGFVDYAHAAVADLAEDAVFAQLFETRCGDGAGSVIERRSPVFRGGLESLHDLERGEELEDPSCQLGTAHCILGGRRILAAPATIEKFGSQTLEGDSIR